LSNEVRKDIAILFVGESAPSENRFFYLRNTILYCAFFMAFRIVYGVKEDEFLEYFSRTRLLPLRFTTLW